MDEKLEVLEEQKEDVLPTEENEPSQEVEAKEKPLTRKEKRRNKLRQKYFNPVDIKYQGPLSYVWLRIIAWVALALGQLVLLNSIASKITSWDALGDTATSILSSVSSLSTPLFIIAAFSVVLGNQKRFRNQILSSIGCFLGIGLGFCIFYARYVEGLFVASGLEPELVQSLGTLIGSKVQINVFSDILAFTLFHFFLNYLPTKFFKGKKIYLFRLFMIIPIGYVAISYVLKLMNGLAILNLPFYVYPFLTTKSPLVFLVFVLCSIWIKNREKLFIKLGATKKDYDHFLTTKRNSLSFSIHLSVIIFVMSIVDLMCIIGAGIYLEGELGILDVPTLFDFITVLGFGNVLPLLMAIPFILLYSYTRKNNNNLIDLFTPVAGIALIALVYLEYIYQVLIRIIGQ